MPLTPSDRISGCLIGTAVGDALGLPCEGLSRGRQRRLFGEIQGHRLFFGRGMVSDDTEHTFMVAQALLRSGGDPDRFQGELAKRLKAWLLCLPAGVGKATLISILRLWAGVSPERSGVFSAGNGPAMRSALLGVCYGSDLPRMKALVRASTVLTHTDPKAYWGALAVARAAHLSATCEKADLTPALWVDDLRAALDGEAADEFIGLIRQAAESVVKGESTEAFAEGMGWGVGVRGYVYQTVPAALHAWLLHPEDFQSAVRSVIRCGGDTDTTAAIVGGIVGARVGPGGIPAEWIGGLWRGDRMARWAGEVGARLAGMAEETGAGSVLPLPFGWGYSPLFLAVVLGHVIRRGLPPY